jgi:hypothetical protein
MHQAEAHPGSRENPGNGGLHQSGAVAAVAPLDAVVGDHGRGRGNLLDETVAEFLHPAQTMAATAGADLERDSYSMIDARGERSEVRRVTDLGPRMPVLEHR